MNKNEKRTAVFNKSSGLCFYCGCGLIDESKMHIDHFHPLLRNWYGKGKHKGSDEFINLVPSCSPCNLFKSGNSIEVFREELNLQVERARKKSINFRNAEKFNLIAVISRDVQFWYERSYFLDDRNYFIEMLTKT